MKTTIEIADDLFERAQRVARREKTTFCSLMEQGLRMVLKGKQPAPPKNKWKPITRGGGFVLVDKDECGGEYKGEELAKQESP